MDKIHVLGDLITAEKYGGKAYWTNWLYLQGQHVPDSVFVPVLDGKQLRQLKKDIYFQNNLSKYLIKILNKGDCVAVRSSAVGEDGLRESLAGEYHSFLDVRNMNEIISCMVQMGQDLKETDRLGVIIQQMIRPRISGVIFSSNPWNGKRTEAYISMVSGTGDMLLSGTQCGEEVKAEFQKDTIRFSNHPANIELKELEHLTRLVKEIEQKLNMPVDVEWYIEEKSNELILLQCRPITTILIKENKLIPVTSQELAGIPRQLVDNDKIWLRCLAGQNQIMISDASLFVCNCQSAQLPKLDYHIPKSPYYSGFSAVLVSPPRINGKIQRYFVGKSKNVYSCAKCHRFGVRSVADYEQLETCLNDLYQIARQEQWTCSIIVQEILAAKYTGIIKKMENGFLIEVARGHFLSKGIFPMSSYLVSYDGQILYRNEIKQRKYLDIVEGCMLEYYLNPYELIALEDNVILKIVNQFTPVLEKDPVLVEFGILKEKPDISYIIDCVKVTEKNDISLSEIEKGIISEGKIQGRLVKMKLENTVEVLDTHFYNSVDDNTKKNPECILFYSEMPSIQLMEILNHYDASQIGFIFKTGSLLCHFAVLLRERGIPAIRGIDETMLKEGQYYLLNTKETRSKLISKVEKNEMDCG